VQGWACAAARASLLGGHGGGARSHQEWYQQVREDCLHPVCHGYWQSGQLFPWSVAGAEADADCSVPEQTPPLSIWSVADRLSKEVVIFSGSGDAGA